MAADSSSSLVAQIHESAATLTALVTCEAVLRTIADRIAACLQAGGTLYLCGNGGSAADAQHVAAELVGRFLQERRPLPAIALTCNTSILTAVGNDYDFSEVFVRQVRAYVTAQDCVVGISTSGRSPNVLKALAAARALGATTVGFTGANGAELAAVSDACLQVASTATPRIQEAHLLAWHLVCDLVERRVIAADGRATS